MVSGIIVPPWQLPQFLKNDQSEQEKGTPAAHTINQSQDLQPAKLSGPQI
jgi:hypothetical protein